MMRRPILCLALLLAFSIPAFACLWDNDTLRDERRGLPGIAEIIAGKFERHSRFFYEHRIQKMKELLAKDPHNLDAYDNLAVAYEKLDDRNSAIDVMLQKEKIAPKQYTTYANLGTFYLHKGDLDHGIEYIKKALEINPNAHFGREEYQLKVAEFIKNGRQVTLPKDAVVDDEEVKSWSFVRPLFGLKNDPSARYVEDDHFRMSARDATYFERFNLKSNIFDGIVGMLRFGTGTSPDLFYALGDLLALRGDKHLAYRAYKRALDFHHPNPDAIKKAMSEVSEMVEDKSEFADDVVAKERAEADAWVKAYQDYEDNLVRAGKDTDDEKNYEPFYAKYGKAELSTPLKINAYLNPTQRYVLYYVVGGAALIIAERLILKRLRSRRKLQPTPPDQSSAAKEP